MKNVVLLLILGLTTLVQAQQMEYCGYDSVMARYKQKNPSIINNWDNDYLNILRGHNLSKRGVVIDTSYYYNYDTIYTLPVVVHVIYDTNNLQKKLSPALIKSQIDVLTHAFMHTHSDTASVLGIFKSRVGAVKIKFELATIDPNGQPTSGIEYKLSNVVSFGNKRNAVKYSSQGGLDAWDVSKYLNIWVCDLSVNGLDVLLGFATPPVGHEFWTGTGTNYPDAEQGAVIHYKVFGKNNPLAASVTGNPRQGRTTVHEIGHYLGMRHIWGDGIANTGCSVDDFIDDTPNQKSNSNFTCQLTRNTCTDAVNDLPDMVQNYMDYSNDNCMALFTKQQVIIMRYTLLAYRPGVISHRQIDSTIQWVYDTTIFADKPLVSQDNNGKVILRIPLDKVGKYTFDIVNMAGQILSEKTAITAHNIQPNLSHLPYGVYICRVYNENNKIINCFKLFGQ